MKTLLVMTAITLTLTATTSMAGGVSVSLRPPEICRKVPILNTNAFKWAPQGCKGFVEGGEAATGTPTTGGSSTGNGGGSTGGSTGGGNPCGGNCGVGKGNGGGNGTDNEGNN